LEEDEERVLGRLFSACAAPLMLKPTDGTSSGCDKSRDDGEIGCVVAMRCPDGRDGFVPILLKREGVPLPFSPSPFLGRLEGFNGSPEVGVRFCVDIMEEPEVGLSIDTDLVASSRIMVTVRSLEGMLICLAGNEVLSLPSRTSSHLVDGVPSLELLFCGTSLTRGNDMGLAVACRNDCVTREKTGDVGGWHKIKK
jgi:hypothetical protein